MNLQETTAKVIQAATVDPVSRPIPVLGSRARLGFPSPADDFLDDTLDLNDWLVRNPAATFYYRAEGDSMLGAGIRSGDILIVDRSVSVQNGDLVLACWGGRCPNLQDCPGATRCPRTSLGQPRFPSPSPTE